MRPVGFVGAQRGCCGGAAGERLRRLQRRLCRGCRGDHRRHGVGAREEDFAGQDGGPIRRLLGHAGQHRRMSGETPAE